MLKRINNERVKPVPLLGGADMRPVKGSKLFSLLYGNIFLCAKKRSGKSSVISKIVKDCSLRRITAVLAFCSTLHKDNIWLHIAELCKKKGIAFTGHTSLKDKGVDLLEQFIEDQIEPEEPEDENEKEKKPKLLLIEDGDDEEEERPRKSKYQAPKTLIILDDLSTELKSKSVERLLKMHRHIHSKVIISSQYLNDLKPESRKQMDYFLIFKGQTREKLETIYKDSDVGIPLEQFIELYEKATDKPYSFFYVDARNDEFRRNFDEQFVI